MRIVELIDCLEKWAHPSLQETYDNSQLIVGDKNAIVKSVLVSLDCTEEVIEEAIEKECNLVISHHPIVFSGLKSLTGKNYVERTVIKAIKHDIAIYAIHTNLDNIHTGVNYHFAQLLGLEKPTILSPKKGILQRLTSYVPTENKEEILNALFAAGAGNIGEYSECSYQLEGQGTFKPSDKANPHLGQRGLREEAKESQLDVMIEKYQSSKIIQALKQAHPYEEVAYYLQSLENPHQNIGSGMVGDLKEEMDENYFLSYLKDKMELKAIKHTKLLNKKIKRVALCGGAGFFLLRAAKHAKADIFITSDIKYHEFFDAENDLILADIGHYESEVNTKTLISSYLISKFTNFAVHLAETNTNPVNYFI